MQSLCDHFEYTIYVPQDIIVPKPQHVIVMLLQPLISQPVGITVRMLSAVQLNDQTPLSTHKVDNITPDGLLASELAAFKAPGP